MDSGTAGDGYFPLEAGHFVIYTVEEQQFPLTGPSVSRSYQLKERIGQPYTDVTGQTAYRLFRYRRSTDKSALADGFDMGGPAG